MLGVQSSGGTAPAATTTNDAATLARALVDMVRGVPNGLSLIGKAIDAVAGQMPTLARQLEAAVDSLLTPVERGQFAAALSERTPPSQAATVAPEQAVTVRRGDTLSEIAAANGTTWQALARANGLADPDRLAVGQRIVIPGGTATAPSGGAPVARPPAAAPAGSGVSAAGLATLYAREAQAGVSDRLHWPGGASGVTLGPGYDLKGRTPASVVADLTAIGVDRTAADRIAQGAGLSGAAARDFAATNRDAVRLTGAQESALLGRTIAPYADAVRAQLRVPVNQNQFDALVSFAYNIGTGGFAGSTTLRLLNAGDAAGAADAMRLWNKSDGQVVQGLVNRREAEVRQFNTPAPALAAPRAAAPAPATAPVRDDFVAQLMANGDSRARADYAAGQRVVVAIRSDTNVRDNPNGRYDDRIAVVWRGADGQPNVRAFDANTEPSGQYRFDGAKGNRGYGNDMNGDGRLELGRLVEGSYRYTRQAGSFLGNTFFRPDATTPVVRDTNGDGRFTAADTNGLDRSGAGRSILIHQGGASNSWSAGCQTLASADYNAFVAALGGQRSFSYVLANANN